MSYPSVERPILVTGGAGFVGAHLCRRLLDDGYEVIALDNFYTGQRKNIEGLLETGRFQLIDADVADHDRTVLDVGAIYHLACPASPVHYQRDPVYTFRTSVWGTYEMLLLAESCGARLLLASTSEVYGDPDQHPQRESYWGNVNPAGLRSCYDEGKRGAETLATDFHRMKRAEIRIARIFNTYGPLMDPQDGRVVSNFIVQALKGKDMTIYGDGGQTRSFCYVSDLVDGLVRLMGLEGADAHRPVNLGNPDEFTVRQLADELCDLLHNDLGKKYLPLPSDDPSRRRPDITRAKEKLGWTPQVKLREGLEKTVDWFREELTRNEPEVAGV